MRLSDEQLVVAPASEFSVDAEVACGQLLIVEVSEGVAFSLMWLLSRIATQSSCASTVDI